MNMVSLIHEFLLNFIDLSLNLLNNEDLYIESYDIIRPINSNSILVNADQNEKILFYDCIFTNIQSSS